MELTLNTWYTLGDLFGESSVPHLDGSSSYTSARSFESSPLQLLHGIANNFAEDHYHYLQFTLVDVNQGRVHGLADTQSISSRVLKEHLVCLNGSNYEFGIKLRQNGNMYSSEGAVCACLMLNEENVNNDERRRIIEVESAVDKGLLDAEGRMRATNRLRNRPILRKLGALLDSSYLPSDEWQLNIIFAQWFSEGSEKYVKTPLAHCLTDFTQELSLQFHEIAGQRDFRVSDLFEAEPRP